MFIHFADLDQDHLVLLQPCSCAISISHVRKSEIVESEVSEDYFRIDFVWQNGLGFLQW